MLPVAGESFDFSSRIASIGLRITFRKHSQNVYSSFTRPLLLYSKLSVFPGKPLIFFNAPFFPQWSAASEIPPAALV
jgi:hypothetical protein